MMGDSNGGGTVKTEPNAEIDNWRAGMTAEMRKEAVKKICRALKNKVPVDNQDILKTIARLAFQCETKLFQRATKKENYIMGLCRKIEVIERSKYADVGGSSSTSGLTPNSEPHGADMSSSLHNTFQFLHDFVGKLNGQEDTQLNVSVTHMKTPRIQPPQQVAYQQSQQQELQHQLLKHNTQQQTNCPAYVHLNTNNAHFHQQQQHIVPQPSQMHYSEKMILPTPLHGHASGQQSNATVFQENQQLDQQNNLSLQQQLVLQENGEHFFEQSPNQQSNFYVVQNMQNMAGPQSNALNLQSHQDSSQIPQHTEVTSLQPKFQQPMQGVKLEQVIMGSQKKNVSSHVSMQKRPRTSAVLHQPQNVFDQQKQPQSQRVFAEVSSAIEPAKDADYNEQAYQKIQSLKKQYQLQLETLHEKFKCASQKKIRVDASEKYKKHMLNIEKLLRFLSMSRNDIIRLARIPFDRFFHDIDNYSALCALVKSSASNEHHVQIMQPAGGQTLISHPQQNRDQKIQFNTTNSALRSTVIGSSSLSAAKLENQNSHSNKFSSVPYMGMKQKSEPSRLQHELDQNTLGASAESNISCNSRANAFDFAVKNQAVQPQHLKRHVQPHWLQQKKQQVLMQNSHMDFSTGMVNPLACKPSNTPDQKLILRTPTQLHATSPPMFQHSCPPSDQKKLSPLSKGRLPLQSATSPLAIPPSSSLNPSSTSVAHAKNSSGVSPLSISEYNGHSRTSASLAQDMIQNQADSRSFSIGISDISASPLPKDITSPDGEQQSLDTKQPIERLIKAVESISPETLYAAVQDIASALDAVDMIAETACVCDSPGVIVHDLVHATSCCTQVRDSHSNRECSFSNKTDCKISATSLDSIPFFLSEIDGVNQLSDPVHDLDSSAVLKAKRQRIEPRYALLDEIRSINQRLIETVIDLDSTKAGEGTIVRCSYNPVALSGYVKPPVSSQWSMLRLLLFIPASYPNSSPEIIDGLSAVAERTDGKEAVDDSECNDEDLSMKAKERFNKSLRKLSGPVSLEEMAKTWDKCSRAVLSEYVQHFGGKCFSSMYGSWDDCASAA